MAAKRVKSRNLFNFRLAGVVDADIQANEDAMNEKMGMTKDEMAEKMAAMSDEEFGVMLKGMMVGMVESIFTNPLFSEVSLSLVICINSKTSIL
jgi:hypothetical protein